MPHFTTADVDDLILRECVSNELGLNKLFCWNDLYEVVCSLVTMPIVLGSAVQIAGPGRCLLYAGVTYGCLTTLFENPSFVIGGGIGIKLSSGGIVSLPGDIKDVNFANGSYHAIAGFLRNESPYFVDFSYHQFKSRYPEIVGPDTFLLQKTMNFEA